VITLAETANVIVELLDDDRRPAWRHGHAGHSED
jgi:hypothetical protein